MAEVWEARRLDPDLRIGGIVRLATIRPSLEDLRGLVDLFKVFLGS